MSVDRVGREDVTCYQLERSLMRESITRRRLLMALPAVVLSAGCSAFDDSSVKSGNHLVIIAVVLVGEHTLTVTIEGSSQTVLLNRSFSPSSEEWLFEAMIFEGEPESIETTIDNNESVFHQWPSPNCGDDEMSGVIIQYRTPVVDEVRIDGICSPSELLRTRTDTTG